MNSRTKRKGPVRYAVMGLGYIAQMAVLPGFRRAQQNSVLTALISGEDKKLKTLGKKYQVPHLYTYDQFDDFLRSDIADALYIALPNTLHAPFAIKAAQAGMHILCEKPMTTEQNEAQAMIDAAKKNDVQLMVAYRLHFDQAHLEAIKIIKGGRLGDLRIFSSNFTRQLKKDDIRLKRSLGGGTFWDLGIYCINAARYVFRSEPVEALAVSAQGKDARFKEVDEMTTATLRFPRNRFAVFTASFGAADTSSYEIIGTKGSLRMEPAYEYAVPLGYRLTIGEKTVHKKFSKHDQFGAQLIYFSNCIISGKPPEPSGEEGLTDVKIIRALYKSSQIGSAVPLDLSSDGKAVEPSQRITLPPVKKPELVYAETVST